MAPLALTDAPGLAPSKGEEQAKWEEECGGQRHNAPRIFSGRRLKTGEGNTVAGERQ